MGENSAFGEEKGLAGTDKFFFFFFFIMPSPPITSDPISSVHLTFISSSLAYQTSCNLLKLTLKCAFIQTCLISKAEGLAGDFLPITLPPFFFFNNNLAQV